MVGNWLGTITVNELYVVLTLIKIKLYLFSYLVLLNEKLNKTQKIELPKEKICLIRATFKNKKISTRVSLILFKI